MITKLNAVAQRSLRTARSNRRTISESPRRLYSIPRPPRTYDTYDSENSAQRFIHDAFLMSMEEFDPPPRSTGYTVAKRTFDVVVSAFLILLLLPAFAIIALIIRLDSPGPALFVQERVGQGGRFFRLLKFRSMEYGVSLLDGPNHKVNGDHRVTRMGKFLRRTSLDELPQLINVLIGEMTLVGPRPEISTIMMRNYDLWQYKRLAVPQGVTGWWQVTGRGEKPLHLNTIDDLYYIEHASFWFDMKILLMTARAVVSRKGAF